MTRSRAGWINVVVAAVIMLATLPGRTQGLGLITEPMLGELRLDRVAYAGINLRATLLGAAICLPIGRLFDRVGLRLATFVITLLLAALFNGWRQAWAQITGGLIGAVVVALFLRERASGANTTDGSHGSGGEDEGLTLAHALKTPAFWVAARLRRRASRPHPGGRTKCPSHARHSPSPSP